MAANEKRWQIGPNPVIDIVHLMGVEDVPTVEYKLLTSGGRLIIHRNEPVDYGNRKDLSLGHLSSGVYVLQIKVADGWEGHKLLKL